MSPSPILGIDVGGTRVRSGVGLGERLEPAPARPTPTSYEAFLGLLLELQDWAQRVAGGPVSRVGIGLPGVVGAHGPLWVPNLPYLDHRPLAADLQERGGLQAFFGNDAQMALVGEAWQGAARQNRYALLVSVGTGIGGAILVGGKILRGARGSAGAFGWLHLDLSDPGEPGRGHLERVASGSALQEAAARLEGGLSAEALLARAASGEPRSARLVGEVGYRLGLGLASLASVFDPEVILVSGGVSEVFEVFRPSVEQAVAQVASPNGRQVPLRRAALGTLAGVYGAVRAAKEQGEVFWI